MSILIKGMEMPEKQVYVVLNSNGLVEVLDANNVLLEEYQAVPIPPHGRWIELENGDCKCSLCGCYHHTWEAHGYYCQHCGARMDDTKNE